MTQKLMLKIGATSALYVQRYKADPPIPWPLFRIQLVSRGWGALHDQVEVSLPARRSYAAAPDNAASAARLFLESLRSLSEEFGREGRHKGQSIVSASPELTDWSWVHLGEVEDALLTLDRQMPTLTGLVGADFPAILQLERPGPEL